MQFDYEQCRTFVKNKLKTDLLPYQWEILRAFCEDKEVRVARGIGRSRVADIFGKYVANVYDKNDYSKAPDIVFDYTCAVKYGLIPREFFDWEKARISPEIFEMEYLCKSGATTRTDKSSQIDKQKAKIERLKSDYNEIADLEKEIEFLLGQIEAFRYCVKYGG